MITTVVARAYKGEVPYIEAWAKYYLDTLKFDKILIIRCDEERFEFINEKRIEFVDYPATNEEEILKALLKVKLPESDYVLSCDVDEYLILHGEKIGNFLKNNPQDSHFFRWALNCSVDSATEDLRKNLEKGCSLGHDGKSIFKLKMLDSIISEHGVQMKHNAKHKEWECDFIKNPYMIHFCSRSIEDLLIRSIWQGIKVDERKKYTLCLKSPPKSFKELPFRFKIAYFQKNLPKIPFKANLPFLQTDISKLNLILKENNLETNTNLFDQTYEIKNIIDLYPKINFYEVAGL